MKHGFIKVAAAAPEIRVADPMFNADAVIRAMDEHARLGVKVLVFPELTLTGATCGDLFYQNTLLAGAAAALEKVVKASEGKDMLVFVGLPVAQGAKVYDAAAAVCNGELLGVVPASCPGDKHFALPGALLDDIQIGSLGPVDFHPQQLFQHSAVSELTAAVLGRRGRVRPGVPGCASCARRCDRARRDGGLPDGDGLRLPRDHRRARRERETARRRHAGGPRLRRVEHRRDVFRPVPHR